MQWVSRPWRGRRRRRVPWPPPPGRHLAGGRTDAAVARARDRDRRPARADPGRGAVLRRAGALRTVGRPGPIPPVPVRSVLHPSPARHHGGDGESRLRQLLRNVLPRTRSVLLLDGERDPQRHVRAGPPGRPPLPVHHSVQLHCLQHEHHPRSQPRLGQREDRVEQRGHERILQRREPGRGAVRALQWIHDPDLLGHGRTVRHRRRDVRGQPELFPSEPLVPRGRAGPQHQPDVQAARHLRPIDIPAEADNTSTVQDVLNGTSVSWKYYDYNLSSRATAIATVHYTGPDSAYDYWNPMASRNESYTSTYASHFATRASFLTDLANGTLPNISWVIPLANASDHPDYNETPGQSWVAQLVDAVESSQYWKSTAIFVVWDDYGGWYDHVAPPRVMTKLLSFRSPFLVISPYARENYIGHQFVDFFSLLHFVEWQFGLGCVTALDCTAPEPFSFFDFNQTARGPILFPTSWLSAHYPMPLQVWSPVLCTGCYQVNPELWEESGPPTGNISLDT